MPILQNAKKALRVSIKKTKVRQPIKSRVKNALDTIKKTPSGDNLAKAFSAIDRAAKKISYIKRKLHV
jgi:ribosomal protein S20